MFEIRLKEVWLKGPDGVQQIKDWTGQRYQAKVRIEDMSEDEG
jgi:hypothetical protein